MKMLNAAALTLMFAMTSPLAQGIADEAKPAAKVAPPAKSADAKKKTAAKKPAAPKKAVVQKPKAPAPLATASPNVRVYKAGDPNAPTLRDKDGNVLPTHPGAYDVSSAKK